MVEKKVGDKIIEFLYKKKKGKIEIKLLIDYEINERVN